MQLVVSVVETGMEEGRCWCRRVVGVGGGGIGFFFKAIERERKGRAPAMPAARGEPSCQTFCQDLSTVMAETRKVPMTQLVANALIGWRLLVSWPFFDH